MGIGQFTDNLTTGLLAVVDPVLTPASPQAEALSRLFVITLFVCAVIFVLVGALVFLCIIRFRRKEGDAEPKQIAGNEKLEVSWTVGSILILVVLFAFTVQAMHRSDPPVNRAPDFTVIGHQWWWEVRYPNGAVTANEIHIPTKTDLLIRLESADVIHDFWVPQLARKMDMIPGHPNHIWLRADAPGQYLGTCAEYCGAQHAWMRILVVAQPKDEFDQWLQNQNANASAPTSSLAQRGERVFREKTCVNCHAIKGVDAAINVAPDLTHFASRETIGAGVMTNTPENLTRWITNPQAIKTGCHMPNFHLTDEEVEALTQYLDTLK